MTTPSDRRWCSVFRDGRSMGSPPLLKTGRVEAADVVDRPLLRGELGQYAAHPGRELVARAAPADADVGVGDAGDRAEHEVVVRHQVVVAPVDVDDVADLGALEPRHALRDEVAD